MLFASIRSSQKPWFIAGLAFVVLGFSRGLHSSFGVFNVALLESFGWSRGATAGIFSVVLSVDALLSPVVSYLLDCYGPKKVVVAGCLGAVIFSALTADIFSGKGFGAILGYSTVAVGVGGALGSWLGGAFYDWTGSYLVSFALSALLLACSDGCIWLTAMPWVAIRDQRLFGPNT
jgi:hypothetical protein